MVSAKKWSMGAIIPLEKDLLRNLNAGNTVAQGIGYWMMTASFK
jgi:hypothetical protein